MSNVNDPTPPIKPPMTAAEAMNIAIGWVRNPPAATLATELDGPACRPAPPVKPPATPPATVQRYGPVTCTITQHYSGGVMVEVECDTIGDGVSFEQGFTDDAYGDAMEAALQYADAVGVHLQAAARAAAQVIAAAEAAAHPMRDAREAAEARRDDRLTEDRQERP